METTILNDGEFVTRDEDLAGFWDMVCLQIEDIQRMFTQLVELKANNWQIIVNPVTLIKQVVKKSIDKKKQPINTTNVTNNINSNVIKTVNSSTKARADAARQRLIEAKKNAALIKQQQQVEEILQAEN